MKIAVSGADGFLGSHVLERLCQEGEHQVVGLTLFPEALSKRFDGWDGLSVVPADLQTMRAESTLDDIDVYLACAFPRATGAEGMAEGLDFVYGSLGVMLDKGCKAVINVSSQSVYDPHRTSPAKESDPVLLTSTYAATKYCVELSVARMCQDKGVPFTNVRMASLIGPGFDQRFVNKMVKSALETGEITVADSSSRFGFLDIRDAADGLVRLVDSDPSSWLSILNLGTNESYGISQIANVAVHEIARLLPEYEKIRVLQVESSDNPSNSSVDAMLIDSLLGWHPPTTLYSSVQRIVEGELSEH